MVRNYFESDLVDYAHKLTLYSWQNRENIPQQQRWVDRTLNGLSLEHVIAQLFNVSRPLEDPTAWLKLLEQLPVGCMSVRTKSATQRLCDSKSMASK